MSEEVPTLDQFRETWLSEVIAGAPSSTEKGRRFAFKIVTQWLDAAEPGTDLVYCDGAGDGGIDLAYLDRVADREADTETFEGDTWYLVQSKYGAAFQGPSTLIQEGLKVIDTLEGRRERLSSLSEVLLERLTQFRKAASEHDQIALVFATVRPLDDEERRLLSDLRTMGRARLGSGFDVLSVSIDTIYQRLLDSDAFAEPRVKVPLRGHFVASGQGLLVGSIHLPQM